MQKNSIYGMIALAALLLSCQKASVPSQYAEGSDLPTIYPDYVEVTVPVNIAPLTFEWDGDSCADMVTRLTVGDE